VPLTNAIANILLELSYFDDGITGKYDPEDTVFLDDINRAITITPTYDVLSCIGQALIRIMGENGDVPLRDFRM
jgi:hypothetical protein